MDPDVNVTQLAKDDPHAYQNVLKEERGLVFSRGRSSHTSVSKAGAIQAHLVYQPQHVKFSALLVQDPANVRKGRMQLL